MTLRTPQAIALMRFTAMRLEAEKILRAAAAIPALPDLYRVQAEAAANLAGMRLHRIHGEATPEDALALRDDIEAIARRVADPLIAAIGEEAQHFQNCNLDQFTDQLLGALDGNASHVLSEAALRFAEEAREALSDTERSHHDFLMAE